MKLPACTSAFAVFAMLMPLAAPLGGCSGNNADASSVLFVNTTSQPLSVSVPGGEAVTIEPGKSGTAAAWGSATVLVVSETQPAGAPGGEYKVPLVRRGPATITARGPQGQLAFDVADPRQQTSAQERQIRRNVIDRPPSHFKK